VDRNGEFYLATDLPPSIKCRECRGSSQHPGDCQVLPNVHHSILLYYLLVVIDSSSLIKQKQHDSFLLKGQTMIIF